MTEFRRTPDELRTVASIWWPSDLVSQEADASIIPRLLSTQDKFISLIHVADSGPDAWVSVLEHTQGLPGNLFLKHLMVLADVGGEPLKRLPPVLKKIFPKGSMSYLWGGKRFGYAFKSLLSAKLDNKKLRVDGASLAKEHALSPLMLDVSMLIMHGGAAEENLPDHLVEKCIIGSMIGRKDELSRFVKQRYIFVSRITGGATANKMGQIAQDAVLSHLRDALPIWAFKRNGTIPRISQTSGKTLTNFDIVAKSPHAGSWPLKCRSKSRRTARLSGRQVKPWTAQRHCVRMAI